MKITDKMRDALDYYVPASWDQKKRDAMIADVLAAIEVEITPEMIEEFRQWRTGVGGRALAGPSAQETIATALMLAGFKVKGDGA